MKRQKINKISVLFLARWYPNRYDPMPGLFIQRHAEALSSHCKVGVVYVHSLDKEKIPGVYQTDFKIEEGVHTLRVYYNQPSFKIPFITQAIKFFRFYRANFIGIKKIKKEQGGFDLLHIHILTRLGLIALFYKWFKNKPYLISEHWSRYLDLTGDFSGTFRKWITKIVVKNAAIVTTVTQNLANAMKNHGLINKNYHVLANVVDKKFFQHPSVYHKENSRTVFINVTCFENKSKNISGLLRVIKSLSEKREDFIFKLVGEGMDYNELHDLAKELDIINKYAVFTGLLEGHALVNEMANADLMVVFSNYENLPVVINESFVLGVPVISTNVGGIPEIINETNGILIEREDEQELEETLNNFLDNKLHFDKDNIVNFARDQFSSETIGLEIFNLYKTVIY